MPVSVHQDSAATITYETARRLLEGATDKGWRLLELFAREQILDFELLLEEFETNQNGLNALLGGLTRRFQEIQDQPGFYIYLEDRASWAIGRASQTALRRALRAIESERQRKLRF